MYRLDKITKVLILLGWEDVKWGGLVIKSLEFRSLGLSSWRKNNGSITKRTSCDTCIISIVWSWNFFFTTVQIVS